jgi:hypothetical protein
MLNVKRSPCILLGAGLRQYEMWCRKRETSILRRDPISVHLIHTFFPRQFYDHLSFLILQRPKSWHNQKTVPLIAGGTITRSGGHAQHLHVPGAAISGAFDFFQALLDEERNSPERALGGEDGTGWNKEVVVVELGGEGGQLALRSNVALGAAASDTSMQIDAEADKENRRENAL